MIITSAPLEPAPHSGSATAKPAPAAAPATGGVPLLGDDEIGAELLAEGKDLSHESRRRIASFHRQLPKLDLFQRLEVGRDADRQQIRRAYHRLSKEFHPDRHYRADLGRFRELLSEVFKAVSGAFDKLSNDEGRAAYLAALRARESRR